MNWIEITAKIGCSNECVYCPQSTLLNAYGDKTKKMDLASFNKVLNNVDKNTTQIHFSGFSEIFLHPQGHEFIITAYQRGFQVCLFSTLVGFNEEKAQALKDASVVMTWVRFHEFNSPHFNQQKFQDACNLFTKTVPCVLLESSKVNSPISRGGSLWDPGYHKGPIECSRFFCNVLLPDGSVVLCCSDWGMKHVIGNILDHHYDSLEFNLKREEFRVLAMQPEGSIICRSCEMAHRL